MKTLVDMMMRRICMSRDLFGKLLGSSMANRRSHVLMDCMASSRFMFVYRPTASAVKMRAYGGRVPSARRRRMRCCVSLICVGRNLWSDLRCLLHHREKSSRRLLVTSVTGHILKGVVYEF